MQRSVMNICVSWCDFPTPSNSKEFSGEKGKSSTSYILHITSQSILNIEQNFANSNTWG